jgi:hypothetical protein
MKNASRTGSTITSALNSKYTTHVRIFYSSSDFDFIAITVQTRNFYLKRAISLLPGLALPLYSQTSFADAASVNQTTIVYD